MPKDHVVILLGLWNGAATLNAQLDSIRGQTHEDWSLVVSDDGSSDESRALVEEYARANPEKDIALVSGPGQGFQANFLSLIARTPATASFAAFCDQDDVWMPEKLTVAVAALKALPEAVPSIYCGRTHYCNENLEPLRLSPLRRRNPSFRNALVESIAGANTYLLNQASIGLLRDAGVPPTGIVSHDWWAYQLVSGAGGRVLYDAHPQILYRLHQDNAVGANDTPREWFKRFLHVANGGYRSWNTTNINALETCRHLLTEENQEILDDFIRGRDGNLLERLQSIGRGGFYRQSRLQTAALWFFGALKLV